MSTHTTSRDDWEPDPAWPVAAIPQRWIEALFSAMSATYGVRFADAWRGAKIADVKRQWGAELARLTSAQMKAGRESMTDLERPPTLPEFMAHCRRARLEVVASQAPQIEHNPAFTPEKAAACMDGIRSAAKKVMSKEPTAEWAYKLLMTGRKDLSYAVVKCASDAIVSSAGKKVLDDCIDSELKSEYAVIRQTIIDNYRMRGMKLWETP